jgi:hypothetical protein
MGDREMLELAAKAAGIRAKWDDIYSTMYLCGERSPDNNTDWNPLTDDGDALRLAVKLNIVIGPGEIKTYTSWWQSDGITQDGNLELNGSDKNAAARRAITRAAAEIGRSMG